MTTRHKTDFKVYDCHMQECGQFLATSLKAAIKQLRRKWGKNLVKDCTYKISGWTSSDKIEWCWATLKAKR